MWQMCDTLEQVNVRLCSCVRKAVASATPNLVEMSNPSVQQTTNSFVHCRCTRTFITPMSRSI